MVWSLVKPPAAAGPLSRIGDYLFAARGPGLVLWAIYFPAAPRPLWLRRHTTLLHHRTLLKVPTRCFIGGAWEGRDTVLVRLLHRPRLLISSTPSSMH